MPGAILKVVYSIFRRNLAVLGRIFEDCLMDGFVR